ncbi:PQ loop repeat-domain-containing protein [Aspergillus pseudonomiae]|uniref:PQ loop repeat-domain-containing protein n=1 Tax=Aspergillus pseudonomiae TaxID=1506151 RepID=A0A5N6HTJ9_9EURO|nr:PQ loop repeat-domain-containing protein [Aspergillus pseudonomiae]KAB8257184.1 PQ loop repeat-domain-containing protein [Aspergillus pseudonomiae]KAE8401330.1 PQ loop repeat-domain-containing protein [Aspergillus pseudonomiae]
MSTLWSQVSMATAEPVPLTTREAASGLLGSISLTCWIFVLVPQLIENYRNGNAEAISLVFLAVWFVGDVTNLIGGLWAGLVPVIVAIAVYFCIADGVLIGQCLYYKVRNSRLQAFHRRRSSVETPDPTTPLLGRRFSDSLQEGPASRRRSWASQHRDGHATGPDDTLAKIVEENEAGRSAWVKNFSSVLAICVIGMGGWTIAWQSGVWQPAPQDDAGGTEIAVGAQVVGYFSAICYLGARLPQIYKNWKDKSCEGLSLLFFILSLLGNLTYGAGILCHSTEKNYIVTNIPWLLGSLGTMVEDITIFIQFRLYAVADSTAAGP